MSKVCAAALIGLVSAAGGPVLAATDPPLQVKGLSALQMFDIADRAGARGDTASAEAIYAELTKDPNMAIRNEARFRFARLYEAKGDRETAALLFRAILDEEPNAARVRLELGRLLALMGDLSGARRALIQAQAAGLPPDVAQLVDQYAAALRSYKPVSMSFELALAPSTNINRATSARTLDTIIAPFDLSDDGRAKSGIGLRTGGTVSAKLPLRPTLRLVARLSGQSSLYRDSQFDDALAAGQLGIEAELGRYRTRLQGGRSYRWYGGSLYATTNSISLNVGRVIGRRSQLEIEGSVGRADYRQNNLQDGSIYDLNATLDHAFDAKMGASFSLSAQRQTAADPGYATTSGGGIATVWRELGKTSVYASAGLYRLEGDARLLLFPERRREWLVRAGAGATFRQLQFLGFSPAIRLSYERNGSSVGLYDYRRFGSEIAIVRAF